MIVAARPAFPPACVVDASILVKLVLVEQNSDIAEALFTSVPGLPVGTRAAPAFALLECGNVFWRHVRRRELVEADARHGLRYITRLGLQLWPDEVLADRALELALQYDATVYDAAYLALADLLDVPLVSADERLLRKAGGPNDRLILLARLR